MSLFGISRRCVGAVVFLLPTLFLFWGCGHDDSAVTPTATLPTANMDIGETVLSSIAMDDGGVIDELADLAALAVEPDSLVAAKALETWGGIASYDSTTGTWCMQITRQRGDSGAAVRSRYTRTYSYQFRNKDGEPQKRWLVGTDTACTMQFGVADGSGECRNLRLCRQLLSETGNWTVTGVNTDTLIINGNYEQLGLDTLRSYQAVRAFQHQLNLMFTNVRCMRGTTADFAHEIQGSIAGTFLANVAFMSGHAYGETNIYRIMNIAMTGGEATVTIGGEQYTGDLTTGEM